MSDTTAPTPVVEQPQVESTPEMSPQEAERAAIEKAAESVVFEEPTDEPETPPPPPAPEYAPGESPDELYAATAQEHKKYREANKELKAIRDQTLAVQKEAQTFLEQAKSDPVAFMNQHGGDGWFMKATDHYLKGGHAGPGGQKPKAEPNSELQALREEFSAFKNEIAGNRFERQAREYWAGIQTALKDEKYALVREDPTAMSELHRFAVGYAKEHKQFLPADQILANILESQTERLERLWQIDPRRAKTETTAGAGQSSEVDRQAATPKTVSNKLTPRAAPPVEEDIDPFDETARITAAMSMLEWNE